MSALDEIVEECRALEASGARPVDSRRIYSALSSIEPSANSGLAMFRGYPGKPYTDEDATEDVRRLRMKAELIRDGRAHELRVAELAAKAAGSTVTVEQHATATSTASASQEVAVALDALSALPDDDRDAAELALGRAERSARAKDGKAFAEQALRVAEIAAKAVEVAPKLFAALGAIAKLFGA